jgi:hypothetical protein
MIREFAALLLVLVLQGGLSTSSRPEETSPGEAFAAARTQFNEDLSTLRKGASQRGDHEKYNPLDLNAVRERTRTNVLAKVPTPDIPLKTYVGDQLPKPVPESAGFVSKENGETYLQAIENLLAKLTRMPTFRFDLTVRSQPDRARFDLIPSVGSGTSTTTNDTLTNVYRGVYTYTVTKSQYKTLSFDIDFIDRSGTTLECQLLPVSDPSPGLPCQLR